MESVNIMHEMWQQIKHVEVASTNFIGFEMCHIDSDRILIGIVDDRANARTKIGRIE